MNVATLLEILQLVGADTPAFIALYNRVVSAMTEKDQATLKSAYAEMQTESDQAHTDAQADA